MKILLYLCTFVFGFLGTLVSAAAVEQGFTGGSTPLTNIVLGIIFLLISLACWHRTRRDGDDEETASTNSTPSEPDVTEPINYYPTNDSPTSHSIQQSVRSHAPVPPSLPKSPQSPSEPQPDGSFARLAATGSLVAASLPFIMALCIGHQLRGKYVGLVLMGLLCLFMFITGLILGIVALTAARRCRRKGIFGSALAGTLLNGVILGMLLWHRVMVWKNEDINPPTTATYDKDGIQFSYDNSWMVSAKTDSVLITAPNKAGVVCLSLHSPDFNPNLEKFARELLSATGAANTTAGQISGSLGGVEQTGLQFHVKKQREDGSSFSGTADFFVLQGSKRLVFVDTLVREDAVDGPSKVAAILNSLKVEGAAAPRGSQMSSTSGNMAPIAPRAEIKVENGFLSVPERADMVHDPKRKLLYITAGDSVLRYQMESNLFLPPLVLGGNLRGIDLSPDGDQLAVADAENRNGRLGIYLVDLKTGTNSRVAFPAELQESGTYSVAYGADGAVWISTSLSGSGLVPLRKLNPLYHNVVVMQRVSQDTMLTPSTDRKIIGFAEARMSPGCYGRINYRATQLPPNTLQVMNYINEVGINHDGTQVAASTIRSVRLTGCAITNIDESGVLSMAYHPLRNYLFVTHASTSVVTVYDTGTGAKIKELQLGHKCDLTDRSFPAGHVRFSADGNWIFCSVEGGIRYTATGLD